MEEDLAIFRNLEQENQALREFVVHLQTNQILTSLKCISATQPNQRNHGLAYLTSLIVDVQSFKVLSTACV
jgi:hypothetical protein